MLSLRQVRNGLTKTKLRIPIVRLRHQGLRSNDVFLASYPRSGNTWLRFVLFELLTGQSTEFESVNRGIPDVGRHGGAPELLPRGGRLIKTHELYSRIYEKAIYLVRDARDVVLSEHSYQLWNGMYDGELDVFVRRFLKGRVNGYGSWANHAVSWLDAATVKNGEILVVKFEDLRQSVQMVLGKITEFLGVKVSPEAIMQAIEHNSVEKMREKEDKARETIFKDSCSDLRFVRQGLVGGWRQVLADKQVRLIEQHAAEALTRLGYPLTQAKEEG